MLLSNTQGSVDTASVLCRKESVITLPDGFKHYKVLGLKEDCQLNEIREKYKALTRLYHPDKANQNGVNPTIDNEEMIRQINEAHATLSDEVKRKAYDRSLGKPDDIIVEEAVTLEKLDKHKLYFVLNTKALCADCNGTGENPNPKACTNCALPPGLRTLSYSYRGDHEQPEATCQMCDRRCKNSMCNKGYQEMSGVRNIDIDVAMLRKGEITLKNKGQASFVHKDVWKTGNLVIKFHDVTASHPNLRLYASLSDHDLVTDIDLPSSPEFPYKISVKTLDGSIHDILIRLEEIEDGIFCQPNFGLRIKGSTNRGDLYFRLWKRDEEPYKSEYESKSESEHDEHEQMQEEDETSDMFCQIPNVQGSTSTESKSDVYQQMEEDEDTPVAICQIINEEGSTSTATSSSPSSEQMEDSLNHDTDNDRTDDEENQWSINHIKSNCSLSTIESHANTGEIVPSSKNDMEKSENCRLASEMELKIVVEPNLPNRELPDIEIIDMANDGEDHGNEKDDEGQEEVELPCEVSSKNNTYDKWGDISVNDISADEDDYVNLEAVTDATEKINVESRLAELVPKEALLKTKTSTSPHGETGCNMESSLIMISASYSDVSNATESTYRSQDDAGPSYSKAHTKHTNGNTPRLDITLPTPSESTNTGESSRLAMTNENQPEPQKSDGRKMKDGSSEKSGNGMKRKVSTTETPGGKLSESTREQNGSSNEKRRKSNHLAGTSHQQTERSSLSSQTQGQTSTSSNQPSRDNQPPLYKSKKSKEHRHHRQAKK
ncbi:unnamed protein product [Orchesella dallaii]|uniref:J domain-containing protein n=1 Tax=Orchesella dallaii TaxID=48710 RepID=A0ABP1PVE7_9HEXA